MNYPNFQYIYPPRPKQKCKAESLPIYDETGFFVAEAKLNGSCGVLYMNGKDIFLYNRHGELMTNTQTLDYESLYRGHGWMVLCGEYLNKNKKGWDGEPFNHKFVIWDILVYDGEYLVGKTKEERMVLLNEIYYHDISQTITGEWMEEIDTDLYLIAPIEGDFKLFWEDIVKIDIYEGFVLKRLSAKLEHGYNENNNSSWQIKCRKPTKNYTI